jgi:glycerophosphoryl diester phosphodiesterase
VAPIAFAHRGGRADDAPENSLVAFRRALELGATGLESDARLSADGQVVLIHGPIVRTGLRRSKVRSLPADRLADLGVPRLTDLYAEVGTNFELSLDLKEPDLTGRIVAIARDAGALDRLWLCARELPELESARRVDPDVRLVHSMGRRAYGDALERHASTLAKAGVARAEGVRLGRPGVPPDPSRPRDGGRRDLQRPRRPAGGRRGGMGPRPVTEGEALTEDPGR